jgi:hypothetical protein
MNYRRRATGTCPSECDALRNVVADGGRRAALTARTAVGALTTSFTRGHPPVRQTLCDTDLMPVNDCFCHA